MRKDLILLLLAWGVIALPGVREANAQNTFPYWSLAGNSNVSASASKLGTTNAVPVRMFTSNLERLRITPTGLVGIGTAVPVAKFEVRRFDGNYMVAKFTNAATTGDRTSLIDVQNGNSILWRYGVGGTGNGLGLSAGQFYIERAGGGAKVTIESDGDVGIGTLAPGPGIYRLKVRHGTYGFNLENASTANDWELWASSATVGNLNLYYNGAFRGSFNATSGAYTAASDARLKTNIKAMPSVLERVNQLKPSTYQFTKANPSEGTSPETYGFLAQDVLKIFPHLVTHDVDAERGHDVYSMDYGGLGVIAIKAIQELQKPMQEQVQKIEKQQQQITELQKQVDELKALLNKFTGGGNTQAFLSGAYLGMISPNPVKAFANISYSIPDGANRAQLVISDALGRISKTIQLNSSGVVHLETSGLSSGVYNCLLVVDDKTVQTRKMTIVQ